MIPARPMIEQIAMEVDPGAWHTPLWEHPGITDRIRALGTAVRIMRILGHLGCDHEYYLAMEKLAGEIQEMKRP